MLLVVLSYNNHARRRDASVIQIHHKGVHLTVLLVQTVGRVESALLTHSVQETGPRQGLHTDADLQDQH